jgi:CAAX protease family protein
MRLATRKDNTKSGLWLFLILTFGFSWLCWIPAVISGQNPKETLWIIPYILGGFGPSIMGVILMYRKVKSREERHDFWIRTTNFRAISGKWYLIILVIFPLVFAASFLADSLLGNGKTELPMLASVGDNPVMLIGLLMSAFIGGALSEELGWRGFALDKLQVRWNPWVSSLILSVFWWAWHLPLFFINGTTQNQIGFGSLGFWGFTLGIVPLTFIMTWAYNHNGRSILSAVLLHMVYNFVISLVYPFPNIQVVFLFLAAAVMIFISGGIENRD